MVQRQLLYRLQRTSLCLLDEKLLFINFRTNCEDYVNKNLRCCAFTVALVNRTWTKVPVAHTTSLCILFLCTILRFGMYESMPMMLIGRILCSCYKKVVSADIGMPKLHFKVISIANSSILGKL